jgi:hypothetical protein
MRARPWTSTVLIIAAIMLASAVTLFAMGRLPFCRCGVIAVWSGDIWSNQNSQQLFDPYTFTHVLHGAAIYAALWLALGSRTSAATRLVLAVALESGWEVFENTDFVINRYREATISLDYYGDSILNSVGDILAMIVGFELARHLPARATVPAAIALDLALVFLIRDSLALNIIMLIYPLDAIRQWQLH